VAAGVLDTDAVIVLDRLDPGDLPGEPAISAITLAELSVGPLVAVDNRERAARQARLQEVEAVFQPLPFDAAAARAFGGIAAALRGSGRKPTARAFDALIAATAVANRLPLYTCNVRDYAGMIGLELVELEHPDR
jgi:predicted nucleic acid-binding protein